MSKHPKLNNGIFLILVIILHFLKIIMGMALHDMLLGVDVVCNTMSVVQFTLFL